MKALEYRISRLLLEQWASATNSEASAASETVADLGCWKGKAKARFHVDVEDSSKETCLWDTLFGRLFVFISWSLRWLFLCLWDDFTSVLVVRTWHSMESSQVDPGSWQNCHARSFSLRNACGRISHILLQSFKNGHPQENYSTLFANFSF